MLELTSNPMLIHQVRRLPQAPTGLRAICNYLGLGGKPAIKLGSAEAQIIADCMEAGWGLRQTTHLVNKHRVASEIEHVGISSVYTCYLTLMPVKSSVKKAKQGSSDATVPWALARMGWVFQLIVRLGLCLALRFGCAEKPCIPLCFTLLLIGGPLETTQIAFWDETHKKAVIGGAGHDGVSTRMQVQFKRDAEGQLNANGTLTNAKRILCLKYSDESRFFFGVAKVCRADGEIEGRRCEAFNYTGKWLHTIKSFAEKRAQEIARVKLLPGHGAPWVTG